MLILWIFEAHSESTPPSEPLVVPQKRVNQTVGDANSKRSYSDDLDVAVSTNLSSRSAVRC